MMIKDLGYTVNAYERATSPLRAWPKLRAQNLEDLEEFVALLDRILISLRDGGAEVEMGGEHLNLTAKEKLTEKDIQAYKYWLFERKISMIHLRI